jgi:hypothetical protein
MGAGAVIAAAACRRRLTQVLDAFRLAGATAPDRARHLTDVVVGLPAEVDALAGAGAVERRRPLRPRRNGRLARTNVLSARRAVRTSGSAFASVEA